MINVLHFVIKRCLMYAIEKAFYLSFISKHLSFFNFETSQFLQSAGFLYIEGDIYFRSISYFKKILSNCSVFAIWFPIVLLIFFLKFLKLPNFYETFRGSRCYIWCCNKLQVWYDRFNTIESRCNYYYGQFSFFTNLQF